MCVCVELEEDEAGDDEVFPHADLAVVDLAEEVVSVCVCVCVCAYVCVYVYVYVYVCV